MEKFNQTEVKNFLDLAEGSSFKTVKRRNINELRREDPVISSEKKVPTRSFTVENQHIKKKVLNEADIKKDKKELKRKKLQQDKEQKIKKEKDKEQEEKEMEEILEEDFDKFSDTSDNQIKIDEEFLNQSFENVNRMNLNESELEDDEEEEDESIKSYQPKYKREQLRRKYELKKNTLLEKEGEKLLSEILGMKVDYSKRKKNINEIINHIKEIADSNEKNFSLPTNKLKQLKEEFKYKKVAKQEELKNLDVLKVENYDDSEEDYDDDDFNLDLDEMEVEVPLSYSKNMNMTLLPFKIKEICENIWECKSLLKKLYEKGFTVPSNINFETGNPMTDGDFQFKLRGKLIRGDLTENFKIIRRKKVFSKHQDNKSVPDYLTNSQVYQIMKDKNMFDKNNIEDIYDQDTLISMLYLNKSLTEEDNLRELNLNQDVYEAIAYNIDRVLDMNKKANAEVKEILKDPNWFVNKSKGDFQRVFKKIDFLDKDYTIKKIKPEQLANFVYDRFKNTFCDTVFLEQLAKYCPVRLTKVIEILRNNYYGIGTPSMCIERYKKSREIYDITNGPERTADHQMIYEKCFEPGMKFMGLIPQGIDKKFVIPDNAQEYILSTINSIDETIQKISDINTKAKGTILSNLKRGDTAIQEINNALYHFKNLYNGDESEKFFRTCFRNIAAKSKREIHSFEKAPRFYNPTNIAGFIPFQYMFNIAFSKIPNFNNGNIKNLLGISDTGNTFSSIMNKLYTEKVRMHYSDNFWISDDNYITSIDVERCDSNLSKEAILYPLVFFSQLVMEQSEAEKIQKLAKIFIEEIPHKAFISFGDKKKKILYQSDFYWLPSGVVGTAYFNHCFTGLFLFITKNIEWFKENGEFTEDLKEMARQYGISLKISTQFRKDEVEIHKDYPFDLLGRYGIYLGNNTFVPHLEFDRMWKSLCFIKPKYFDKGGIIAAFIRLAKLESLISLGAMLDPDLTYAIYVMYVIILSTYRSKFMKLTVKQYMMIQQELMTQNLDINSFYYLLFTNKIMDLDKYIIDKTGMLLNPPKNSKKIINQILDKIKEFDELKAVFIEIIDDQEEKFIKKYEDIQKPDENKNQKVDLVETYLKRINKISNEVHPEYRNNLDEYGKLLERFLNTNEVERFLTGIIRSYVSNGDSIYSNKLFTKILDLYKENLNNYEISNSKKKEVYDAFKKYLYNKLNSRDVAIQKVNKGQGNYNYEIIAQSKALQTNLNKIKFGDLIDNSFYPVTYNIKQFEDDYKRLNQGLIQHLINLKELKQISRFDGNVKDIELIPLDDKYKSFIKNMKIKEFKNVENNIKYDGKSKYEGDEKDQLYKTRLYFFKKYYDINNKGNKLKEQTQKFIKENK